ncbi:hypothetical protein A2U01_0019621, partial [Trifolium medium]|nr:hypothetical protein [Trifolium medium]
MRIFAFGAIGLEPFGGLHLQALDLIMGDDGKILAASSIFVSVYCLFSVLGFWVEPPCDGGLRWLCVAGVGFAPVKKDDEHDEHAMNMMNNYEFLEIPCRGEYHYFSPRDIYEICQGERRCFSPLCHSRIRMSLYKLYIGELLLVGFGRGQRPRPILRPFT